MVGRHELLDRAVNVFNARQRKLVLRRAGSADGLPAFHALDIERRRLVAQLYIAGKGLEIGALQWPLRLPPGTRVRYVDRLGVDELRAHYPGMDPIDVDLVEDGERLPSIPLASQDFIVANHFLEHCEDPILTLETLTSRICEGGVLYLAVPDADLTFDARRPSTPFAHVLDDHLLGAERSRGSHVDEWVRLVEEVEGDDAERRAGQLLETRYSIHYHVWRLHDLLAFFARVIDEHGVPLRLECAVRSGLETICVLRREGRRDL
jgi:hypothetical protein